MAGLECIVQLSPASCLENRLGYLPISLLDIYSYLQVLCCSFYFTHSVAVSSDVIDFLQLDYS